MKTRDGEERNHKNERDEGAGDQRKRGKKKAALATELAASKEDGKETGSEQGTGKGVKRSRPETKLDVSAPTTEEERQNRTVRCGELGLASRARRTEGAQAHPPFLFSTWELGLDEWNPNHSYVSRENIRGNYRCGDIV